MTGTPPPNPFAAKPWACLGVAATGTFMATLDGGIVNVALPTIAQGFGADLPVAQWAVTVYLLVIACLLPAFGRLGDMHGRRRKYRAGFLIFAGASALCGAAGSMGWLIAGRALQAVGAALLMANGPAIVVMSFPGPERGRALGMIGMVVSLGSLAGPSLGGLLVDLFGWPSIFYVNLPVGLAGAFFAGRILPDDRRETHERFDLPGAALYAVGVVFLLTAVTHGGRWGWSFPGTLACFGVAAAGLALFLHRQARVAHPVVDLSLFRIPELALGNLASLLAFMALLANAVLLPFFLARVVGLGPGETGLVMAVLPLAMSFVAPLSGFASEKVSHALLTGAGMACVAGGLYSQTLLAASAGFWRCAAGQAILGVGFGLFLSPNNNAVLGSAPRAKSGVAGAVMALVRNLGMVCGIAVATAVYEAWRNASLASGHGETEAFHAGFDAALTTAACLALAGMLLSVFRALRKPPKR
ncbi:Riboflavin transporter RibZ [Fundidesulfovibrio magnetotacticus]|uniref:Riboflavin transporter RibZ n=1 Tax=Fundidesulfovibrio magnetotacticus TaxID=2730080 RepID=A0A6V8LZP4_9BACT|nr:DHA2 family efflux MFS transporter permease subunit [Fundidesulfovibrio magnetotacticus]GFK95489.1 Riboflavin transporter RibZ [Fundidesulfovibrio magnetotacticus]